MGVLVQLQFRIAFEALLTSRALVGSLSCVDALVHLQFITAFEALPTLRALKGSLSCVDALVAGKVVTAVEALPTLRALKGSLSCVDSLVAGEVGTPFKALPTLRALVGSPSCMDALETFQFGSPFEALPTLRALVQALRCVHALVVNDTGIYFQAFPTLSAWILLFHLTHILAPGSFRLLFTYVEVQWAPSFLFQMLSQCLLDVLTLTLLQASWDIPSDFSHTGTTPPPFGHTTFLHILQYICNPSSCWRKEEIQKLHTVPKIKHRQRGLFQPQPPPSLPPATHLGSGLLARPQGYAHLGSRGLPLLQAGRSARVWGLEVELQ